MKYQVTPIRAAGLLARWTKAASGAPYIEARTHDAGLWKPIDVDVWTRAKEIGLLEAYKETYPRHAADFHALADIFPMRTNK